MTDRLKMVADKKFEFLFVSYAVRSSSNKDLVRIAGTQVYTNSLQVSFSNSLIFG